MHLLKTPYFKVEAFGRMKTYHIQILIPKLFKKISVFFFFF